MTTTRSAISATTPKSWVMNMTPVPWRAWMSLMRSRICAWVVTSSAVVGSSAISRPAHERQRHGDHDALALAAGELVGIGMNQLIGVRQVDVAHDLEHPGIALRRVHAGVDLEHLGDLVADLHHRIERGHRLLEDHRHALAAQAAQLRLRFGEQVLALSRISPSTGFSSLRGIEAHDRVRRHRFAGAGFADHADDLAAPDREGDALDGEGAVRALGQADRQAA